MELASLGLAPSILKSLVAAGFRSRRDVLQCTSARELAHETKLSVQESIQVLGLLNQRQHREEREVAKTSATSAFTAHDALSSNRLLSHIHGLDELLGGGFVRGQVIEFCGRPGIGKTQLSMHLACSIQLQLESNDPERRTVIYIDTEGSFIPSRIQELAQALDAVASDEILRHILYFRVYDVQELLQVMTSVQSRLLGNENQNENENIQLLVIDSIAFPFRQQLELKTRQRLLSQVALTLQRLSSEHQLVTVLINQMTTSFGSGGGSSLNSASNKSQYIPALGQTWAHAVSTRIQLRRSNHNQDLRWMEIIKSPDQKSGQQRTFGITSSGITCENGHESRESTRGGRDEPRVPSDNSRKRTIAIQQGPDHDYHS